MLLNDAELTAAFSGAETFAAIARRAGVSREYIRQVYNERFADVFPNRKNVVRLRRTSQKILTVLASGRERWSDAAAMVANRATKAGCKVQSKVRSLPGNLSTASNLLLINDHTCVCHQRKARFLRGGRKTNLYHVMITRAPTAEFHVLVAGKNLFVVPTEVLHRYYASRSVYIPSYPRTGSTKSLDWWQYKDAWWQLKAKET